MKIKKKLQERFRKHHIIECRFYMADHRLETLYIEPKDNQVEFKNKRYILTDKDYYINKKGIPVYTYNSESSLPINPHSIKVIDKKDGKHINEYDITAFEYSASALQLHKKADTAKKLLEVGEKKLDTTTILLMLNGVLIAAVAYVAYMMMEMQGQINEFVRLFGGS